MALPPRLTWAQPHLSTVVWPTTACAMTIQPVAVPNSNGTDNDRAPTVRQDSLALRWPGWSSTLHPQTSPVLALRAFPTLGTGRRAVRADSYCAIYDQYLWPCSSSAPLGEMTSNRDAEKSQTRQQTEKALTNMPSPPRSQFEA